MSAKPNSGMNPQATSSRDRQDGPPGTTASTVARMAPPRRRRRELRLLHRHRLSRPDCLPGAQPAARPPDSGDLPRGLSPARRRPGRRADQQPLVLAGLATAIAGLVLYQTVLPQGFTGWLVLLAAFMVTPFLAGAWRWLRS